MDYTKSIFMLFRIILLITVSAYLLLLNRKKINGSIIYQWKTSVRTEFIVNTLNIGSFISAMLFIIFLDEGLFSTYRYYKIILDGVIISLIVLFFTLPKNYILTDKGILFEGNFIKWSDVLSFEKKNDKFILYLKKFGLLKKIEIIPDNYEKIYTVFFNNIKK